MAHEVLQPILEPYLKLKLRVQDLALERLFAEGLQRDAKITDKDSRFYNDPAGYAMHHFTFSKCFSCANPYFTGAAACGENADPAFKPEDLLCTNCQQVDSMEACKKHGTQWLSYKCRFCCKVSIWFCFGAVHFCEPCHNNNGELVDSVTGNRKKIWEYTQCPGLRERLDAVAADRSLSLEEREKLASNMVSDPKTCPLGVRHKPNGIEYGIGCGLCMQEKDAGKSTVSTEAADAPRFVAPAEPELALAIDAQSVVLLPTAASQLALTDVVLSLDAAAASYSAVSAGEDSASATGSAPAAAADASSADGASALQSTEEKVSGNKIFVDSASLMANFKVLVNTGGQSNSAYSIDNILKEGDNAFYSSATADSYDVVLQYTPPGNMKRYELTDADLPDEDEANVPILDVAVKQSLQWCDIKGFTVDDDGFAVMLGDNQEEVRVDQSTGTTIWYVVCMAGVAVRVDADYESERTGLLADTGMSLIITEVKRERGNVYLKLDPCNGLGEGWVFALDYDTGSDLIVEEVILEVKKRSVCDYLLL